MSHLPPLIYDLAIILSAAAVSILLFSRLKQPIVLGYLIAGFLVGPYFTLLPTVADVEGIRVWAEIGVIFLLFGLGLEFSFKKLAKVGKSAGIAALFEIITMTAVGYLFGRFMGWSQMDGLFLGAILSMSSTTIIIKAFDDAGMKGRGFVNLVFGILIVEDLMAILLLVLLAAISVPENFSGSNLTYLSLRLGFFLLLWFVAGIYLLPTILKRVRPFLTSEITLIVSIGLCLMMVVLATKAGFSAALGAFVMGSILAETEDGKRIEHLLGSVKDLFAAVFFVSVGMLIDPAILWEHFWVVLSITILTIVGKLFGSGLGALLSGRSLKQSVQAGMSLAQIGEFSFIIATLGVTLKVTSDFLYPVVIAVSAVTTFTTPYMIRLSGPFYSWAETKLPQNFLERLHQYEIAMASGSKEGALTLIGRIYGITILLNTVMVIAATLAADQFLLPKLHSVFPNEFIVRMIAVLGTLITVAPFLWAIVLKKPKNLSEEEHTCLIRLSSLQPGIILTRVLIGFGLIAFIIDRFTTTGLLFWLLIAAFIALLFSLNKFIEPFYHQMETRFLQNLNANERSQMDGGNRKPELAPWDASLAEFTLSSDSLLAGKTLEECDFRGTTGAMIALIDRGRSRILAPGQTDRLLPSDRIFLIGNDEQISVARRLIEALDCPVPAPPTESFSLESMVLENDSPYVHKSIRECGLREKVSGLIVGIEREGRRILNPDSAFVLVPGDLLWLVGRGDEIRKMK